MITLSSAENVLKDVYLGVIADQINTKTNPLFNKIKRSTRNIVGKEVRVAAPIGINGGIMAGTETSELPEGVDRPYLSFVAPLKNLYGRFEISDKAVRCSSSDVNAFVNLLQDGMDSLLQASIFNLSRMLYGNGTGKVSAVGIIESNGSMQVETIGNLVPGMFVDFYNGDTLVKENVKILGVDKATNVLTVEGGNSSFDVGMDIYAHGSKGNEIIGLKGIIENDTLYGVDRSAYPVMNAYTKTGTNSDTFDEEYVQAIIDELEMRGTEVNFINCSYELKRVYQKYLTLYNKNIDYVTLDNGSKTVAHVGTPIVPSIYIEPHHAMFLNTDDFVFYELGDWKWLEDEAGRVLRQNPNKPAYSATLVKYTELVCQKPSGVGFVKQVPYTIPTSV